MPIPANERGQYGATTATTAAERKGLGLGGVLALVGITAGIYALSPGARHYYKHGRLPPQIGSR